MRQLTSCEVRGQRPERLLYTWHMTTLLEKALSEVSLLPPEEQDRIAAAIIEELAEIAFDEKLAATAHLLEPLVRKVQGEYRAGLTEPLDLDRL